VYWRWVFTQPWDGRSLSFTWRTPTTMGTVVAGAPPLPWMTYRSMARVLNE
jgi:hypothetical protein